MKLGIMQPYFFPYLGYFQLINATDKWVVFDVVQYMRHHWVNRNRVLHPKEGWQYIVAPVKKHERGALIQDVETLDGDDWKNKIVAQLGHYKKRAPFFADTVEFVRDCLFTCIDARLARLNAHIMKKVCTRFGLKFDFEICSEMALDFSGVTGPGDWALEVSAQLGAATYINPPGGREIFDPSAFASRGVELRFIEPGLREYKTRGYGFEPGLSIIDVMMWNSTEEIKGMLEDYEIAD